MAKTNSPKSIITQAAESGSVEMPRATAWPLGLAAGISLVLVGAATSLIFCAVGAVLFVISLGGWIANLLPGEGHEHEAVEKAGVPAAVRVTQGTVQQLKPGVVGYRFQLPEKVHPVSAGVRGGIVGGVLMPIPALIWAVTSGHSIWFPVNLLAGLVIPGLDDQPREQLVDYLQAFHPWLLAGAVLMHISLSIGFGLIGGVIIPTLPQIPGGPLVFGGLILPLAWTGANHSLLGIVNPVLNEYINWRWYLVSQLVYGIATSIVIMRSEKIPIAPRGRGHEEEPPPSSPPSTVVALFVLCALVAGGCSDNLPGKPNIQNEYHRPDTVTSFSELYALRCASCHGADGTLGPGPPLNDELFVALAPESELRDVIANGRHGTLMPAWAATKGGPFTEAQLNVLVQGIQKRAWDGEKNSSQAVFPFAPPLVTPTLVRGNAEAGAKVFATACAGCHGEKGEGGKSGGAINEPAFLALMSDQVLRRYVVTGRADLGMPNFAEKTGRDASFTPLTAEQVNDLVALLVSWRRTE